MPERIPEPSISFPPELQDYHDVNERLGEGGFAKVILAEHRPTGQKVAIKIMSKDQLRRMGDLHRAYREIEAMKRLGCHQHICQLYQVAETEHDIFLVLEYISGGELFDYIVSRERLSEKESRSVFRQIVSAVTYIHSKGLAHRDLKPENMLLDANNNIKLIDFGLCSNPDNPIVQPLATCCGSPAYAAPELISGKAYYGAEADVWSLGVVLYGLLNGFLPFDCEEDEAVNVLYGRIKSGAYEEPEWLSEGSKNVLSRLLEVHPGKRITAADLLHHPWLSEGYGSAVKWESSLQRDKPDIKIVEELADLHGLTDHIMEDVVKEYKYDRLTAHYYLLYKLRQKTPRPKVSFKTPSRDPAVSRLPFPKTPFRDCQSVSIDDIDITPTRKERSKSCADPGAGSPDFEIPEKEYISPLRDTREKAASQVDNLHMMLSLTPAPARNAPIYHPKLGVGVGVGLMTPKFAKRIGKRVANLMTPKKSSENPRKIKAVYKVSTTSTKPCHEVRQEVERVLSLLRETGKINTFECSRYLFKCKGTDEKGVKFIFQVEICAVPGLDHVLGLRHTRLKGDSWSYKKICDQLLQALKI